MLEVRSQASLAQASDFTVTPWLVTPGVLCPAFSLWCPGGLVVNSVAHRNELREDCSLLLSPQEPGRRMDVCGVRGVVV